jgi:hypothetical protein
MIKMIPGCIYLFTLSLLVFYNSSVKSQDGENDSSTTYKTEINILYRDRNSAGWNEYMEERCRLDLYYPVLDSTYATIVWFHGGGLTSGNSFIPEKLKNQNIAVAAVNYRLSPKVICPAYIQDAAAAVAWIFNNIQNYGGSPDLIIVSGASAGAYLTSMIGLDKSWLAAYNIDADKIAGLIPISGHMITHFTVRAERNISGIQPIIDEFAPLYHVRPDAPPIVLITGDRNLELFGRYEENAYFMRMMKIAGHQDITLYELQGFDHGTLWEPAYFLLPEYIMNIVRMSQNK